MIEKTIITFVPYSKGLINIGEIDMTMKKKDGYIVHLASGAEVFMNTTEYLKFLKDMEKAGNGQ